MRLFLLFIVVPALELWLLMQVGEVIGLFPTFGLILVTGVAGAVLAKAQGLSVLRSIQEETAQGRMPAGSLLDGVLILIAGALLSTG